MKTLEVSLVLSAALLLVLTATSEAKPFQIHSCLLNTRHRVENVDQCKYGWERDACGNTICTKGPGEQCGGRNFRYGICGEGLMCSNCGGCQGCSSITYKCFSDEHCIW